MLTTILLCGTIKAIGLLEQSNRLCGGKEANHFHIFGGCQNLTPYRQKIKRNLETVFEVEIVLIVNLYIWVR